MRWNYYWYQTTTWKFQFETDINLYYKKCAQCTPSFFVFICFALISEFPFLNVSMSILLSSVQTEQCILLFLLLFFWKKWPIQFIFQWLIAISCLEDALARGRRATTPGINASTRDREARRHRSPYYLHQVPVRLPQ